MRYIYYITFITLNEGFSFARETRVRFININKGNPWRDCLFTFLKHL